MSLSPVFIVGCQRSGSTLLGSLIGGHPDVICLPEAQFVADLIPPGADLIDAHELIGRISNHWRFKIWHYDLGGRRPEARDSTYADAIRWLAKTYASDHNRPAPRLWIDQQPGHGKYLHRLWQHFPDLKVIHIVRDGRAVAASLLRLDWGPNEIHSAAYFWEQRLAWAYSAGLMLGPERFLTLRYEDVVMEPEVALRRAAEFMGLAYHPDMLLGTGLALPQFTKTQHALVGRMPDPSRIESWRQTLTPRQIEIFESIVGDTLPCHGYPLICGLNPPPLSYVEKIRLTVSDQTKVLLNAIRFRMRRERFTTSG